MARPGNDRRHTNAAFEQTELGAAIWAGAAPAEMRPILNRVAIVGLKHNNRAVAQAKVIKLLHEPANAFVQRGDEGAVEISGVRKIFVALEPFHIALIWIMREIDGEVEKERLSFVLLDTRGCFAHEHIGKELPVVMHLFAIAIKIMNIRPLPVKEM